MIEEIVVGMNDVMIEDWDRNDRDYGEPWFLILFHK